MTQQSRLDWLIEKAIIPVTGIIVTSIISVTIFIEGGRTERSRIEQGAVTNYLLQMTDILLNLEGVEGIIKWSKETEKEDNDYNREIRGSLNELASVRENELKKIFQNIQSNQENKIPNNLEPLLNKINNNLLSALDGIENIELINLENKLNDLDTKLEKIKDAPNYDQLDHVIYKELNLKTALDKLSEKVTETKDLERQKNSKVDRYLLTEAEIVVQTKTSNVLFMLSHQSRRQAVIEFLRESQLGFIPRNSTGDGENDNLNNFKRDILSGMALVRSEGINLSGNDLGLIQLKEGKLSGANLKGASLSKSTLSKGVLTEADFTEAYLIQTQLNEAELIKANLTEANLTEANLKGATLTGANLKGATLTGANLEDAILESATNLNNAQIKSACNWDKALYESKWDATQKTWIAIEPNNGDFIKEIKNHKSSDPKTPPNCSQWQNGENANDQK